MMMTTLNASRRLFMRHVAALSSMGAAMPVALNLATISAAAAQTTPSDYKAIVCLFLAGGNDSHNIVLATDPTSFNVYTNLRTTPDTGSIALNQGDLLPITPSQTQAGRSFALHPKLTDMRDLFNSGRLAILANVGTLLRPMVKADYVVGSSILPQGMYDHDTQSICWQNSGTKRDKSNGGWGNLMGDLMHSANGNPLLTCVSVSGTSTFLAGKVQPQVQVGSAGAVPINGDQGTLLGSTAATTAMHNMLVRPRTELFSASHQSVVQRALSVQSLLQNGMLPASPSGVPNPTDTTSSVAKSLQTVARMIGGQSVLQQKRQIFFVRLGGFDTHDGQADKHDQLWANINSGLKYFDDVLSALNMRDKVTLFTASDFGRTLTSNGDGTDHGWGSHHFIMGGAVKGGNIYGRFPITDINTPDDVGSGRLLPAFATEQYAATLAKWFGLSNSQINDVFPNLANFSTKDLGFML